MSRHLIKNLIRAFSTKQAKPTQFNNYYLLRLQYGSDGYYETYEHRKVFAEQVKKLQDTQQARILGGDNFPKKSTTLIFNCNDIQIPTQFANNCIYNTKQYVTKTQISQLDKISTQKYQKLWHFYQPKIQ